MRLDELSQQIAAYQRGRLSLDAFEDWFRLQSRGMFAEPPDVLNACLAVEEAFSELRAFGDQDRFRRELAKAAAPFASAAELAPSTAVCFVREISIKTPDAEPSLSKLAFVRSRYSVAPETPSAEADKIAVVNGRQIPSGMATTTVRTEGLAAPAGL